MTEKTFWQRAVLSFAVALLASIFVGANGCSKNCDGIRENVFRLHVIANSDSAEDQQLKLAVRDEILSLSESIFSQVHSREEAEAAARTHLPELERAAERAVSERGYSYPVRVEVSNEYFNTRFYEQVTLPAGKYDALRVIIGKGAGKNWWCVMFPQMCLPAAEQAQELDSVLTEAEMKMVTDYRDYEIRFKLVEWYESLKQLF